MTLTNYFYQYLYLNGIQKKNQQTLKDKFISNLVLLRDYQDMISIYYLFDNRSILIPRLYIDTIVSFDIYQGNNFGDIESDLDSYILYLIYFTRDFNSESLDFLIKTGSFFFRDFLLKNFNYNLDPWILDNLLDSDEYI